MIGAATLDRLRHGAHKIVLDGESYRTRLRVPATAEARGNLHVGGRPVKTSITARDREIIDAIRPFLHNHGQIFVGLDVIGGMLTELNITSPTGIRHIARLDGTIEGVLLIGLIVITPNDIEDEHPRRRRTALSLTAFVSAANIFSLGALTHFLLHHNVQDGRGLVVAGVLIWLTNLLIFALWYWEMDRGGPGLRSAARDRAPDFLFPQMSDDRIEPRDWRPKFFDYFYVSLTNNTAFSPTDTMPLTPMTKAVMGVQSVVSLLTIGLIVSRAVNIL